MKFDYQVLQNIGIHASNLYFDTMVAAYIINPGSRGYSLDALSFQHFGHNMQKIEELIGAKGKQGQLNMGQVDPEKVADYAAEDADFTWQLYQKLQTEIKKKDLTKIFFDIEMPQVQILGDMERAGIKLNKKVLSDLSVKVNKRIKQLETKIYKAAGKEFNIASPLQLSGILFDKLKLETRGIKKNKTGISTAASELQKMRDRHPIINFIFEYRELAKLRSTYIIALPELVKPKTKRIHTSFNQVVTATGRLSSSKPNILLISSIGVGSFLEILSTTCHLAILYFYLLFFCPELIGQGWIPGPVYAGLNGKQNRKFQGYIFMGNSINLPFYTDAFFIRINALFNY